MSTVTYYTSAVMVTPLPVSKLEEDLNCASVSIKLYQQKKEANFKQTI